MEVFSRAGARRALEVGGGKSEIGSEFMRSGGAGFGGGNWISRLGHSR